MPFHVDLKFVNYEKEKNGSMFEFANMLMK